MCKEKGERRRRYCEKKNSLQGGEYWRNEIKGTGWEMERFM